MDGFSVLDWTSGSRTGKPKRAESSRATPMWLSTSTRCGVIVEDVAVGVETLASPADPDRESGCHRGPGQAVFLAEHIALDGRPRSLILILKSWRRLGRATTTLSSAVKFLAPQTILVASCQVETLQQRRRSAPCSYSRPGRPPGSVAAAPASGIPRCRNQAVATPQPVLRRAQPGPDQCSFLANVGTFISVERVSSIVTFGEPQSARWTSAMKGLSELLEEVDIVLIEGGYRRLLAESSRCARSPCRRHSRYRLRDRYRPL